jgi:organic hydroperoxide reductase OsmC/OhrA
MTDKTTSVHWEGQGKKAVGRISTQTDALKSSPYGFSSRFEDDRRGTNPEELLAAAHAACFTMAFSFACEAAGFATSAVDTTASVRGFRLFFKFFFQSRVGIAPGEINRDCARYFCRTYSPGASAICG